jgi:hypothetical protein
MHFAMVAASTLFSGSAGFILQIDYICIFGASIAR